MYCATGMNVLRVAGVANRVRLSKWRPEGKEEARGIVPSDW